MGAWRRSLSVKNPHALSKHPFHHLAWRRLMRDFRDYKEGRLELKQWETDTFIPELLNRIKYLKDQFATVHSICHDPHLLDNIGAALLKVVKHVAPGTAQRVPFEFVNKVQEQAD